MTADPFNDAWAEANAVIPGVFWVDLVAHVERMDPPNSHCARAVDMERRLHEGSFPDETGFQIVGWWFVEQVIRDAREVREQP